MTINYIHIYDLLAGGQLTGVKEYTRVQGEENSKFNDIHSLLAGRSMIFTVYKNMTCAGSYKLCISLNFELSSPCTLQLVSYLSYLLMLFPSIKHLQCK